jgi:tetratricopeptide (TPR) repeat protein
VWGYPTRDVARILGLPEAEVRRFARVLRQAQDERGFVSPRRDRRNALRFSFQDLVLLKAAAGLVRARVPAARVRRALVSLKAQLPEGRSLATVRIASDGAAVTVRDGGTAWRPDTGKVVFDFDVRTLAEQVAPLARVAGDAASADEGEDAEALYAWACDLEATSPAEAEAVYRRALAREPSHPGANLNLGRLLHEAGDLGAAEAHYRRALEAPEQRAIAAFDLGVVLEDSGRDADAAEAYRVALAADPSLADAHFNLSRLLERSGRREDALRHLGTYRRLVRG